MNNDLISREALAKRLNKVCVVRDDGFGMGIQFGIDCAKDYVAEAPTIDAVPVDVVAQMLCDALCDECPCNYSGADEWLPEVCELQEECPNPKDRLGCWKQYIKHFGERKE